MGKDSIPIFVFHEVDTQDLQKKLSYLKENDYHTLDCAEWLECLKRSTFAHSKKVLLTFDDGHISLWQHAYPLLKKYDFKAVSFICPGLVPNEERNGGLRRNRKLCSWSEIKVMHASGHVDFQSHSLHHDLVFTSSKLIDFFNTHFVSYYLGKTDKMVVLQDEEGITFTNLWPYEDFQSNEFLGLPVFDLAPRFATDVRFQLSKKVMRHIQDFVKGNGHISFFERNGWKNRLRRQMLKFSNDELGQYVSVREYQKENAKDLTLAKNIIEDKLPGKKVQHFCAPWFKATETSLITAFLGGYISVFLGEGAYTWNQAVNQNGTILKVPRLPEKYIFQLPGKGRKTLRKFFF